MARLTCPTIRLSLDSLARLPAGVARPDYDPRRLTPGIVHLGVGNFHRAHQAAYTDTVLALDPSWAISGVSLQRPDMHEALAPQDGLYALMVRDTDTPERLRVIAALRELRVAAHDGPAVLARLADPATRIVSLTITEKGYSRAAGGELALTDPDIAFDLARPPAPRTALGFLMTACERRHAAGLPGFTVLSCDNLSANGDMTRGLLLQFAQARARLGAGDTARHDGLVRWIEREMAFPNGMVDRIVPHTTAALREQVAVALGMTDAWPVATEGFSQWVLEDRFVAGRPAWERAGVQFVGDVAAFEDMKLRLLNAAHSAIAYLSVPAGLATVDVAIAQPLLRRFIAVFWHEEAVAALAPATMPLAGPYCEALLARFGNTALAHRTDQIAMDGSLKLPLRLLPTLRWRLAAGAGVDACALVLAAWIRFLEGRTEAGEVYAIRDPLAPRLTDALCRAGGEAGERVGAVLRLMLGADDRLTTDLVLRGTIAHHLAGLNRLGTLGWLSHWLGHRAAPG